jgi:HEPN domain-containing protein
VGSVRRPAGGREGLQGRPLSRGSDAWGHDLTALLTALPRDARPPDDLLDRARGLDKHYIPSRYPNGFAAGTPRDHYTEREAVTAIADAEAIIEFCARSIPG